MSHDPLICSYAEVVAFIEGYIRRADSLQSLIDDIDQGVLERELKLEVELLTSSEAHLTTLERLRQLLNVLDARQHLIVKTAQIQQDYLREQEKMEAVVNSIVEDMIGEKQEKISAEITETRTCKNPECGKLFIPKSHNSKYCSMKCSSRVRYKRQKGNQ